MCDQLPELSSLNQSDHPPSLRSEAFKLHNVADLLTGTASEVFDETALAHFKSRSALRGKEEAFHHFVQAKARGVWLSRLPNALRNDLNVQVRLNALNGAGAELRCVLLEDKVSFTMDSPMGLAPVEIWWGGSMERVIWLNREPSRIEVNRPPRLDDLVQIAEGERSAWSPRVLRLVLPWDHPVRFLGAKGSMRAPIATETPRATLLIYGSSITQGGNAVFSFNTYARILARRSGLDLTNLGFGGGAHLEPEIASYICEQAWDVAICEMGINVRGDSLDEFARRVDSFIGVFEERRETRPLRFTDIYTSDHDFLALEKTPQMREVVKTRISASPLSSCQYYSGLPALASVHCLTPDLIHPSPEGMMQIAAFWQSRLSLSG